MDILLNRAFFGLSLDLLLSVPLISAVVTPSWSTYMNILFFWTVRELKVPLLLKAHG